MSNPIISKELEQATGRLPYTLRNDYMFRCLFQVNPKALKGLLSALLRLPVSEIKSAEITNPIVIGEACDSKEFRLDILVNLNNHECIDIELQVDHFDNWIERSISYLARLYDSLIHGDDYSDVKPTIHIGILDHTLFSEHPIFYSQNLLMDKNTFHIYSDKFALNVLDLKQIQLASDEDKQWGLDYWAALFKANTWEELKMISTKNEDFKEVSESLTKFNADWLVRKRCRDREDYYAMIHGLENKAEKLQNENTSLKDEVDNLKSKNEYLVNLMLSKGIELPPDYNSEK